MVPDRIEHEVVVEAPVERVWAVLTEPEHVGAWFGESAQIDLRPGGEATFSWEHYGAFHATVEKVEPLRLFSFRWARPAGVPPAEGNSTLVEFTLSPEGAHTRLRVVETGFRRLDLADEEKAKYAEENTQGWTSELDDLREYVGRLAGVAG